jgi:hypothetical protein
MFAGNERLEIRCQANGAIAKGQAVKVAGAANGMLDVAVATAATDKFIGIALEGAADNAALRVCILGKCEAIANGTITIGTHDLLSVTSDGELEPYAVGDRVAALFLGAKDSDLTAAANDLIDVLVIHGAIDTIE